MHGDYVQGALAQTTLLKGQYDQLTVQIEHLDCISFLKSLEKSSIDVLITDPAYSGMNNYLKLGSGRIVGKYQSENNQDWFEEFKDTEENYLAFLKTAYDVMKENSHIYIMFDSFSLLTLAPLVRKVFHVKNVIAWDKVNMGMGHYFRRRHEFIIFATKGNKKLLSRSIPDVWSIKRIRANYPTQKPVELFQKMINASVTEGANVCDPFLGSGSSAIAALKSKCNFFGADISTKAHKLSQKRVKIFKEKGIDMLENHGKNF